MSVENLVNEYRADTGLQGEAADLVAAYKLLYDYEYNNLEDPNIEVAAYYPDTIVISDSQSSYKLDIPEEERLSETLDDKLVTTMYGPLDAGVAGITKDLKDEPGIYVDHQYSTLLSTLKTAQFWLEWVNRYEDVTEEVNDWLGQLDSSIADYIEREIKDLFMETELRDWPSVLSAYLVQAKDTEGF